MGKAATKLAQKLLKKTDGDMEELRLHWFEDDESAHDDEGVAALYEEFGEELKRVQAELSELYGKPKRTGKDDDEDIPLNGVFRFAVWNVKGRKLWVAAAHEERDVPIMLMVGTV